MRDINNVYANIVNLKMTPNELVLEFGIHFQDAPPKPGQPIAFEPSTRIIMTAAALDGLHGAISQAVRQRNEMLKAQLPTAKAQ